MTAEEVFFQFMSFLLSYFFSTVIFLLLVNYILAFGAFPLLNTKLREAY
jgi:hypothetical protein